MRYTERTADNALNVKVKSGFGVHFDTEELNRFFSNNLRGFMKPLSIKSGCVEYQGPVAISLGAYMHRPVDKRTFMIVIAHIVHAVEMANVNHFNLNNICFELEHIYINEATKEIHFLYIPLIEFNNRVDIAGFFEKITYIIKPDEKEKDKEFALRFISLLKSSSVTDISLIKKFIWNEEPEIMNTLFSAGNLKSGFITDKQKQYIEHYAEKRQNECFKQVEDEDEETGILEEGTMLLEEDDEDGTSLLIENHIGQVISYPKLKNPNSNQSVEINKPAFRIGKERNYVDYFIANNPAVSRNHADIITRGDRYYIKDLNSKNHTYVNDERISAQMEIEIFTGDRIRIANEELIFEI